MPAAAGAQELVAPAFVTEGANGSVIVDPTKIPAKAEEAKPEESRPEWLDAKFKSPEDLAKAYKELESKLGTNKTETPTPTLDEAKSKGIDVDKLSAEYAKDGKLSAESLKALNDAGFTEAHVNAYVEGQKAKASQTRSEFAEAVGGEEQLTSVLQWAEKNLDQAEQDAYNQLLESGNQVAAKIVLKDIASRFTAAEGENPALVEAETVPGTAGIKPFGSWNEVQAAMNDKRYKENDRAYHTKVQQRLSISNDLK